MKLYAIGELKEMKFYESLEKAEEHLVFKIVCDLQQNYKLKTLKELKEYIDNYPEKITELEIVNMKK